MEKAKAPGIWLVTANDALVMEMEWTLKRASIVDEMLHFASSTDVRDALTLRIRDGGLPVLLAVDVRANAVGGSQLVKWVAGTPGLTQILVLVFMGHGTAANVMHVLGADVVFDSCPDAAKLAQLHGIASQLAQIPPTAETRPSVPSPPPRISAKEKKASRARQRTR